MRANWKKISLTVLITLTFIVAFWFIPYDLGDDWATYKGSVERALQGQNIYAEPFNDINYFSNPPWVIVLLIPLGILPAKLGWAILSCLTFLSLFVLARRYQFPPLKLGLLLLSPPVIYTILHGQIDALVLVAFLLPLEFRPIIAITKPQISLGLLFYSDLRNWKRTVLITLCILAVSFLVFGNWPGELIQQSKPFINAKHNYLAGTWPLFLPVAIGLSLAGIAKKDLRFFMAASPFFSPYAAVSSFIGVWFASCSALKTWQTAVVLVSWWGVILYKVFASYALMTLQVLFPLANIV